MEVLCRTLRLIYESDVRWLAIALEVEPLTKASLTIAFLT